MFIILKKRGRWPLSSTRPLLTCHNSPLVEWALFGRDSDLRSDPAGALPALAAVVVATGIVALLDSLPIGGVDAGRGFGLVNDSAGDLRGGLAE